MATYRTDVLALHAATAAAAQKTLSETYRIAREMQTDALNAQVSMTAATPAPYRDAARTLLFTLAQSRSDVSAYAVAIESQLTAVGVAHAFHTAAEIACGVSLQEPADRAATAAADRTSNVALDTAAAADAAIQTSNAAAMTLARTLVDRDAIAAVFYAYRDADPNANRLYAEYTHRHALSEQKPSLITRSLAALATA